MDDICGHFFYLEEWIFAIRAGNYLKKESHFHIGSEGRQQTTHMYDPGTRILPGKEIIRH